MTVVSRKTELFLVQHSLNRLEVPACSIQNDFYKSPYQVFLGNAPCFILMTYHLLNESNTHYSAKKENKRIKVALIESHDLDGPCLQSFYLGFFLNAFGGKTFVI